MLVRSHKTSCNKSYQFSVSTIHLTQARVLKHIRFTVASRRGSRPDLPGRRRRRRLGARSSLSTQLAGATVAHAHWRCCHRGGHRPRSGPAPDLTHMVTGPPHRAAPGRSVPPPAGSAGRAASEAISGAPGTAGRREGGQGSVGLLTVSPAAQSGHQPGSGRFLSASVAPAAPESPRCSVITGSDQQSQQFSTSEQQQHSTLYISLCRSACGCDSA